ncbi:MAG: choice-of-anchor A family protein [Planctomycetota bacterium]
MPAPRLALSRLAASLAAAIALPAVASPLEDFTLIVFEDMTSTSNVEGRGFIGGNLSGGEFGAQLPTPLDFADTLLVGGNLTGGSITSQKGNIRIGGDVQGGVTLQASGNSATSGDIFITGSNFGNINANAQNDTVTLGGANNGNINNATTIITNANPAPIAPDITPIRNELESNSADWAAITANTSVGVDGNKRNFDVSADDKDLYVFSIDASLFSTQNIEFDLIGLDADETVLINVTGSPTVDVTTVNFINGFTTMLAEQRVLFNFPTATSIDFTRTTFGALLAPLAHVTNTATLEGTLVAKSFDQDGEVHLKTFTGTIPEPASLALLSVGLGVLMRRSR